jgi:hypothetical protein
MAEAAARVSLVSLLLLVTAMPTRALPALQPSWQWSWDTIPTWASGQGATDFQRNISAYYADNFDIMWTQGADLGQHPGWDSRPGGWTVPPGASYSTWEGGVISDLAKVHALREMPGFVSQRLLAASCRRPPPPGQWPGYGSVSAYTHAAD